MSPSNRTIKVGGVWAQGAIDPPATPVQSTTYADSGVTEGEIQAGWPFADIVESAKFNEVMRRITSLIKLAEEWGVLPWNSSTTYATKALVMGSNGEIYYCKVASSTGNDPTTSPTQWGLAFEASGSVSTHAGLASPHSGQTPKTLSGATTNTVDSSGHTHVISAASETDKGAVELATAAETTAGTDNSRAVHPAGLKVELDKKAPLASPVLTGVVTAGTQIVGGFGATSTAGVLDWNDASNSTSGQGPTLLRNAANGPPDTAIYFHSFTFEYSSKNGAGNATQLAIPYTSGFPMYMRVRATGTWGAWQPFILADAVQGLANKTLVSPTLTGTPTAPTAALDSTTTQVATTAFVNNRAADSVPLMDGTGAVGASIRYARQDHRHPTDTTRAPLASPALTGTPTAPTATTDTSTTQVASTAFVTGQAGANAPKMDGTVTVGVSKRYSREDHIHPTDTTRAPVASPALTGTPTAPTAALDTSTTQVATTAFVVNQAGTSAPAMDGTAAVGTSKCYSRDDHRHPTDTTRAPLASPALTGTPTAPTAANGTNTTQLATTAFAHGEVSKAANGYQKLPSGMVKQWGSRSCSFTGAATNNSVVFPAQFPTACVSVTLTYASTNIVTASLNIAATSVTNDGFNISTYSNNAFSGTVFWTAEGY